MAAQAITPESVQKKALGRYTVVAAVMLPTMMELLDASVVNVSLPHIGGSLGASVDEATWVLTSYLVANAIVVPLGGWLSHRFGRKRLILSTIAGFTISSVLCGLAPTLPLLVFFRVLQGLTGGGLQPLSQSVLYDEFPKSQWQKAMAYWAVGVVLAPTLGPTIGGWVTQTWSWHWIFYANLPLGIISWKLVSRFIDDPPHMGDGKAAKFDGIGIAFLALGMAAMQIVLDRGEQADWFQSTSICWLTAAAIVFTGLLIYRELRAPNPFLKVRLFKDFTFAMGSIAGFLMYAVLFGSIILVPLFMEEVFGWDAITTGWNMGARGIGSFLAILLQWVPGFSYIKKSRWTVIAGFAIAGLVFVYGYGGMDMHTHGLNIFWPQAVQGFFTTLAFMPLVTVATSNIEEKDRTYATSLYGMIRNLGSSAGVSFVAIFLDKRTQIHQAALAPHGFLSNPAFARMTGGLRRYFMLHGADSHLAAHRAVRHGVPRAAVPGDHAQLPRRFRVLRLDDHGRSIRIVFCEAQACLALSVALERRRYSFHGCLRRFFIFTVSSVGIELSWYKPRKRSLGVILNLRIKHLGQRFP